MKAFFIFLCSYYALALAAQPIAGDWYGTLDAMGTKLALVIHIQQTGDQLSGSLDSPGQQAFDIPMDAVSLQGNQFSFRINQLGASYQATLSELGLSGDFKQAGFDFPLDFGRTPPARNGMTKRPQEPNDFPYLRETVRFPGGAAGITLEGELTLPTDGEIQQAVILVSGSGGQDRNSELGADINHRPFLVLSDFLTRQGIAVLRYDDRGIAQSSGDFKAATTADFTQDAAAALRYLAQRKECQKAALGIIGHSEGGLIAAMVAAEEKELDFVVSLAGPGIPSDTLLILQSMLIQEKMMAPPAVIERNLAPIRKAYAYIKEHPEQSQEEMETGLVEVFVNTFEDYPAALQRAIGDKEAFARSQIGGLNSTWFRYFLSIDPAPYWSRVRVPVLAINGSKDLQVPARINLEAIAAHLSNNNQLTLVELPDINHLFQTADTGLPTEYGGIEETFNPTAMRIIANWIANQKN